MKAKGTKSSNKELTTQAKASIKQFMISDGSFDIGMGGSPSGTRRNGAATIVRTAKYKNIREGIFPYSRSSFGAGSGPIGNFGIIDVREAVLLCQMAYYNIPIFRNTIDTMTELSNSTIYLKGGNDASKIFVEKWLEKIDIWGLCDRFFREYYRSGNVFIYRFSGDFTKADKAKFNKVFGTQIDVNKPPVGLDQSQTAELDTNEQIPLRYIMLNAADIRAGDNITFNNLSYFKVLTNSELIRLRNPKTEEDMAVIRNLGPEAIKQIKQGSVPLLPLDIKNLSIVFYNKQDYEPFAVPFGFPVLEDIDVKLEFKKQDAAINRTLEYAILLVTMGESPKDGGVGMNPSSIATVKEMFENESIKKVLVGDWTMKADWKIPELDKVLGVFKYEQLDKDIKEGLGIIVTGDDKFANSQTKVEIFVERLKKGRKAFKTFLMEEIRSLCKNVGFKNYPTVEFEEINLKNEIEFTKLYTQLCTLGILTPNETIDAIQTGQLPTSEELMEAQLQYKKDRANGLFVPLVGTSQGGAQGNDPSSPGGRPTGKKAKKSTKKVTPQGKKSTASFSQSKLISLVLAADKLENQVNEALKKKFKIKEFNETQALGAKSLLNLIITNENPESWESSIKDYIKEPKNYDESIANEIDALAIEHNVTPLQAALLFHSQIEE